MCVLFEINALHFDDSTVTTVVTSLIVRKLICDLLYKEISIWLFYLTQYILPVTNLLVYWSTVMYALRLMLVGATAANEQQLSLISKKRELYGYSNSSIIVSSCMHSSEWTGYLQESGKEPVYLQKGLHGLELNAI